MLVVTEVMVSTCSWVVGPTNVGEDFTELQCDVSIEGSDVSCISQSD